MQENKKERRMKKNKTTDQGLFTEFRLPKRQRREN